MTRHDASTTTQLYQTEETFRLDDAGRATSGSSATVSDFNPVPERHEASYAYDAANGKQLWSYTPPEGVMVNSAPAIYSANGKEYVAWNVDIGTKQGPGKAHDEVLAFSLPS